MNRRAFLGSGLASLFVGVFALLMGGGLPRPKVREGDAVPIGGGEVSLGITPAPRSCRHEPDHLRILKPWDGKTIQEAEPLIDTAYGYYDSDPRVKGLYDMDAFRDAYTHAKNGTHPDHWHAEGKQADLTTPGRQFGLG